MGTPGVQGAAMVLPRFQLFEFNDAPWAPPALRAMLVESLSITLERLALLDGLVDPLAELLAESGTNALLDLGSGAGGPAKILLRALAARGQFPHVRLSDLHPRIDDWERVRAERPQQVDFVADPVDATAIPDHVGAGRARMIVNVLHHFPPALVAGILRDTVRARAPVLIAESFGRNPAAAFGLLGGLTAVFTSPLRGDERLLRAALAWGSPVALAVAVWDTFVSTLRIYEEADLRKIIAAVPEHESFIWQFGTYPVTRFGPGIWCSGRPLS